MAILPTLTRPGRPARPRATPSSPSSRTRSARRSSRRSPRPAATSARRSGVVELTIALHRLLESPRDRIVWDTGHQAYPHKLLTGRYERFDTLRQLGGVGGFPRRSESAHDVFDGGHAGTGLSIGQGLADGPRPAPRPRADRRRRRRRGPDERPVARGAQRHRPAPDADADRPQRQRDVDQPDGRGALSKYLARSSCRRPGGKSKSAYDRTIERIPVVGQTALELSQRLRKSVVNFAQPGQLFEDLGITYIGVVPGHDLRALLADVPPARSSCTGRSSSTSGPRRAAATGRPRPTRSASTARRCRR